ncbi:MAG: TRAP transporter substrate-binding protein DctP [Actinomycetales bacterium]|nr:TRAP transporter substrate-binding protein DctP [Actinomycetales bacterium]
MFSTSRRTIAIVGLAGVTALVAGCTTGTSGGEGTDDPPVTLVFGHVHSESDPSSRALQQAFDQIEEESGGSITIDVSYDGSLVTNQDSLTAIKSGRADLGWSVPNYFPAELPLSNYFSLPFSLASAEEMAVVIDAVTANSDALGDEFRGAGVEAVAFYPNPPSILSSREPMDGLDAIQGKSMRALGDMAIAIGAAGGNSVNLPIQEVYQALDTNLLDGYVGLPMANVPTFSLNEVSSHIYDAGIGTYSTSVVIANSAKWDSLTEHQQEIVRGAFQDAVATYLGNNSAIEDEVCADLTAAGVTFDAWSDADREQWAAIASAPAIANWKQRVEDAGLDADGFLAVVDEAKAGMNPDDAGLNGVERCAAA